MKQWKRNANHDKANFAIRARLVATIYDAGCISDIYAIRRAIRAAEQMQNVDGSNE
jgi:hypothetical protein